MRSWNTYGLQEIISIQVIVMKSLMTQISTIALNLKVITRQDRAIPDIDARNNLLVDERLLQLVGLLVAFLNGELLDLG